MDFHLICSCSFIRYKKFIIIFIIIFCFIATYSFRFNLCYTHQQTKIITSLSNYILSYYSVLNKHLVLLIINSSGSLTKKLLSFSDIVISTNKDFVLNSSYIVCFDKIKGHLFDFLSIYIKYLY